MELDVDLRWLEDELDDDGTRPYKEGDVYICRNCAREISYKAALCLTCKKRRRQQAQDAKDQSGGWKFRKQMWDDNQ